jgi:quercetin dioxygenase-like cupin family protein
MRSRERPLNSPQKEITMKTVTLIVIAFVLTGTLAAQQPAFKRTVLQQGDVSVPGREAITAVGEFQPGATPGRHTHFGEEVGYVLEGTLLVEQDGKAPVTLKAGGTFLIPAGTIHNATNTGTGTARVLATYIVEKGKPLATPAPAK